MKQVVIFGAGGVGRCAGGMLTKDSPYEVVAFTAHERYIDKGTLYGREVVPYERIEELYPPERYAMFIALGYEKVNRTRAGIYEDCKRKGYELVSYISPKANLWGEIEVGEGCFIMDSTTIHSFTKIGNNVFIGGGCHIGHDVIIGDHCFLAAHTVVLGCVTVEPYCLLGANATINNAITVARECIVGAGVTITKNTEERGVYVNRPPELIPKPSDELASLLAWCGAVQIHSRKARNEGRRSI